MIKSMTAFASADRASETLAADIEIRTYNSRHLDILLRLAPGYQHLEEKIRGVIIEKLSRGRVEVKIQLKDSGEALDAFEIDVQKAGSYYKALKDLQSLLGIEGDVSLELIASRGELIKPKEKACDMENTWRIVEKALRDALEELDAMRQREGACIADDFLARLQYIKNTLDTIEKQSLDLPEQYRIRLKERIAALTGETIEFDTGRIEQEAAIMADKSDISEEILRVKSHLEQFKTIMDDAQPAGQKLNFLLQEINREFNTIGSKAGKAEISHMVVNVKSELEKLREQVQNVE